MAFERWWAQLTDGAVLSFTTGDARTLEEELHAKCAEWVPKDNKVSRV